MAGDFSGQIEQSYITVPAADSGVYEVFEVTLPATAGATQADYFTLENFVAGEVFAVWLDIDADGTAPTGAAYVAADFAIEADIATGDSATVVAAAVKTALEASGDFNGFTITADAGVLTFTSTEIGNVPAAVPHNANDSGAGSVTVDAVTAGADSDYQSTYFTFRNDSDSEFYAWMNVDEQGVDPAATGTGIEVAFEGGASASVIAAAIASAVNAHADFEASSSGAVVQISAVGEAAVTDAADGDMGVTVAVQAQGLAQTYAPVTPVTSLDINPSA
jgi:hypothetical protein